MMSGSKPMDWVASHPGRRPGFARGDITRFCSTRITEFSADPWPRWVYSLEDGTTIAHEVIARHGSPVVALSWRVLSGSPGTLSVRPFFSGRDYHSLHRENGAFRFDPESSSRGLVWRPYDGVPAIHAAANGDYHHQPDWYRNFRYEAERDRELDYIEDLASPGVFTLGLDTGAAVLVFSTEPIAADDAVGALDEIRSAESTRRAAFASPLHRAADAYLVKRGAGQTIIAGHPWFADWGRDTFIALRGVCLAADRIDEATRILLEWSRAISEGMLPNRFPDRGELPSSTR